MLDRMGSPTHLVVVGLGYVGLPLAQAALNARMKVTGLDRSKSVVSGLASGVSHVDDVSHAEVKEMIFQGFEPTTDESVVADADVVVICVPTPLSVDGSPDLTAVTGAASTISRHLRAGALVVLESTTFPGTTEDVVKPLLERPDFVVGNHFNLAFSPERVDPGNAQFNIVNTPKVVGGITNSCTDAAAAFYGAFVDEVVRARGAREAETAKLLENTYRHINIALVNEMARVCHEMGIDVWDVIRCASTKPFGFQAFYPGPGVGGHCIPIDPNYLSFAVKSSLGYPLRFVELAQEINETMPSYVFRRTQDLLNAEGLAVRGARVLLVGITYKANISDQRESPADALHDALARAGADVRYHDPLVESWRPSGGPAVTRGEVWDGERYDVAVVLQHHDDVNWDEVISAATRVLDARGRLSGSNVEWL